MADATEGVVATVAAAGGDDEVVFAAGIRSRKTMLAMMGLLRPHLSQWSWEGERRALQRVMARMRTCSPITS